VTIPAIIRLISARKRAEYEAEYKHQKQQELSAPWALHDEMKPYSMASHCDILTVSNDGNMDCGVGFCCNCIFVLR
jgi:hypothetical protein